MKIHSPPLRLLFTWLLLALASLLLHTRPTLALTPQKHSEIARLALTKHIRPSYEALVLATSALEKSMHSFCAKPNAQRRETIEQGFEKALLSWSRIDHIRFGPISQKNRISRFVFWPDHKNIGLKQVKKALRRKNKSVLSLKRLQGKSVALQGLSALEFLLYGKGRNKLAKKKSFRCAYAKTITKNLALMSRQTLQGWRDGSPFAQHFLHPNKDNPVYLKEDEITLALFLSFTTELKIVYHLKLGRPLGKSLKKSKPRRAAFWRSGLSYKVIEANMKGVADLFDRVFGTLVSRSDPGVEEGVLNDFEQVSRDLKGFTSPIQQAVYDKTARAGLLNLQKLVDQIKTSAGRAIIKAADLSMGFNALDGD